MDVLEDRQEDFECLAAAVPRFASMLLAPEGDLDAPDIPTPRSYAEGVDYFQTFSPTMKMTTLWVLLHVAAQRDYELHSLDFSTAFLRGSLHEEIWLRRPPGFTGSFPAGSQWSLRRPVYGLRQAPHKWQDTLRTTLAALGFAPSTADPSLFLRTDTSLPPFYALVYVDDLVFATADTGALTLVKSEPQKRHTCTDLGELRSYLSLQITRDRARRTITLTQSHMVHQVFQRFRFQFSSPQPTPLSTSHSLSAPPSNESVEPSGLYPKLVGCLMYLMTCTRSDLAYPLSLLARYVAPGRHRKVHWDAAKRVLCYLCSTSGMGLMLGGRGRVVLTGHVDASWCNILEWKFDPVTTRANTADIFTKALPPGDHQRFSTVLGLLALLFLAGLVTTSLDAWHHLNGVYQPKDSVSSSRLLQQLLETKMALGEKVNGYIYHYRSLRDQIAKLGSTISEEIFVIIVLQGLSPEWQPCKGSECYISNVVSTPTVTYVTVANNARLRTSAQGIVVLRAQGSRTHITLNDVLILQNLHFNLLSAEQLMDCGVDLSTDPETRDILLHYTMPNKTCKQIGRAHSENGVYILDFSIPD
ncbi:unnamed protein product [Closterium sp. NIES-53]